MVNDGAQGGIGSVRTTEVVKNTNQEAGGRSGREKNVGGRWDAVPTDILLHKGFRAEWWCVTASGRPHMVPMEV